MLSLILFRHGKSDWDSPYSTDHERPLTSRGKEAARCMGRMLSKTRQVPGLAVSSSAIRARESLHLAARAGHWKCPIRIDSALYESSATAMLSWLKGLDDAPDCLLLTGHEPTWSDLAGRLVGKALIRVPTGAMLRVDLEIEAWQQIEFGVGELRWLLPPKVVCGGKNGK